MDREAVRNLAKSRRNQAEDEVEAPRKLTWKCEHCEKELVNETVFMKHRCKEKVRAEELRSPLGQAAYVFYSEWMKVQGFKAPPIQNFAVSRMYSTFVKFATHVKRVHLPTPNAFIRSMVDSKIDPTLWCRDNVYALYMKGYDAAVSPTEQFVLSLQCLEELAADYEVQLPEVFEAVGSDKLLELARQRKLSPWFLAASTEFKRYARTHDKERLEDGLQIGAFIDRLRAGGAEASDLLSEFVQATQEVGL